MEEIIKMWKKDIPQASLNCGLEISTGQTKILLAADYQTTANFKHWKKKNKQLMPPEQRVRKHITRQYQQLKAILGLYQ